MRDATVLHAQNIDNYLRSGLAIVLTCRVNLVPCHTAGVSRLPVKDAPDDPASAAPYRLR
jgi:hypothetical protein